MDFKVKFKNIASKVLTAIKWVAVSVIVGVVIGGVGVIFNKALGLAVSLRTETPWLLLLLPVAGIVIVGLYRFTIGEDPGTNRVLGAVHSGETVPVKMAPLIFVSTVLTQIFGGSAGREGAALQLGGSLGEGLGKLLRFDDADRRVMVMAGMSAGFCALFGTPLAAAVMPMEFVTIGYMHYVALLPCTISSLTAFWLARACGCAPEAFPVSGIVHFEWKAVLLVAILAILCGFVGALFCYIMHIFSDFSRDKIRNPWVRVLIGGAVVVLVSVAFRNSDYTGTGMNLIERCFHDGTAHPWDFAVKMLLTAVTLAAGYKGGEIVPAFTVGATFGCAVGTLFGLSAPLATAVGMTAVFCAVTNSPITAILIAMEMFGPEGLLYYLLAASLSFLCSGDSSLYHHQKMVMNRFKFEE